MAKITLDIPDETHLKVKQEQLTREMKGEKINLRELYYEIILQGLRSREKNKK